MNKMVSIHTAEAIQQVKQYGVTHLMVHDEYFSSGKDGCNLEQLNQFVSLIHAQKMTAVLKVDRLYDENEIEALTDYLLAIAQMGYDEILFSDVSIKVLVDRLKLPLQTIYAPETLLTNQYDVAQLKNDQFSSCVISKDIPLQDIYTIAKANKDFCYVRVHGPILISYSKRRFISIYLDHPQQYTDAYYLQEENRSIRLPIVEKETGSWVYGYTLESIKEIQSILKEPFKGIIIDNMLYDDEYTLKVLALYDQVQKGCDLDQALEQLKEMDQTIEYGSITDIKKTFLEKK